MLCQTCQDCIRRLFSAKPEEPETLDPPPGPRWGVHPMPGHPRGFVRREKPHHTKSSGLRRAAEKGCPICLHYWNEAANSPLSHPSSRHSERCSFTSMEYNYDTSRVSLAFGCRPDGPSDIFKCYGVDDAGHEVSSRRIEPHYLLWVILTRDAQAPTNVLRGATTGSDEALDVARSWLAGCKTDHAKCSQRPKPTFYPTRLLDLRPDGDSSESHVRLIITSQEAVHGPYNTLSHCWGRKPFLCLIDSNMDEFKAGIDPKLLTRTFQDAIEVSRTLGVRYLWIDSLCIIQKSESDWLSESKVMDEVYANGFCNLSATVSSDGSQGLLRNRSPSSSDLNFVSVAAEDGSPTETLVVVEDEYWWRHVDDSTISKRAWVYQERRLSPRTLHFAKHELLWECCSGSASETFPVGTLSLLSINTSGPLNRLFSTSKDLALHHGQQSWSCASALRWFGNYLCSLWSSIILQSRHRDTDQIYGLWWTLQDIYSRADITYLDDKVLAISGLAKRFEPLMRDTYRAGLWQKRITSDLLWRAQPGAAWRGSIVVHARNHPSPSFSWLSLAIPVRRYEADSDTRKVFNVKRLNMEFVSSDRTGFVKNAVLSLRARMIRIQFEDRPFLGRLVRTVLPYGEHLDWELHTEMDYEFALPALQTGFQYSLLIMTEGVVHGEPLFCLVLELHDASEKTFRRVGSCVFGNGNSDIVRDVRPEEALYPCDDYDSRTGRHLVRIV